MPSTKLFPLRTTLDLRRALALLLSGFLLSSFLHAPPAAAQRHSGSTTLGVQVGQPGGLTAKLYRDGQTAYDALVTTDGDDFVSLYVHRLWERPLPDSLVHLYVGPGVLLEARSLQTDPTPQAGLSAEAGLNFFVDRFEVFLHLSPALRLLPRRAARLGASVGLRYRLR